MDELVEIAAQIAIGVRNWLTFVFALLAAVYGWRILEELRRQRRVFANGDVEPISDKTMRVRLRLRNQTPRDILVTRISVLRPRPAIVAMEEVYDPGPGPIPCNHLVPAFGGGALVLLLGSPEGGTDRLRLRIRFQSAGTRFARARQLPIVIDTRAALAPPD